MGDAHCHADHARVRRALGHALREFVDSRARLHAVVRRALSAAACGSRRLPSPHAVGWSSGSPSEGMTRRRRGVASTQRLGAHAAHDGEQHHQPALDRAPATGASSSSIRASMERGAARGPVGCLRAHDVRDARPVPPRRRAHREADANRDEGVVADGRRSSRARADRDGSASESRDARRLLPRR